MRRIATLTLAVCLIVAMAGTALAGGWAVTTLGETPTEFEKDSTYEVSYTILQHGRTPAEVDETSLNFMHAAQKHMLSFGGEPTKTPGEYVARVTLPTEGAWSMEVNQGVFGIQDLGELQVVAKADAVSSGPGEFVKYVVLVATLMVAVFVGIQIAKVQPKPNERATPSASGV